MICLVKVLFRLEARIAQVLNVHRNPYPLGGFLYVLGDLSDGKDLRELVEDSILAPLRRILNGQLHAAHGVAQVYVASRLAALAVHG